MVLTSKLLNLRPSQITATANDLKAPEKVTYDY
jgi:hypothetical protein